MRKVIASLSLLALASFAMPAFAIQPGQHSPVVRDIAQTVVTQPPPSTTVVAQPPAHATGYRPDTRLVYGGLALFGLTYGATVIGASVASDVCEADVSLGCDATKWPIYVPIVGPFIQMGYVDGPGRHSQRAVLAVDGVLQGVGAAMFMTGFLVGERTAVADGPKLNLHPVHMAGGGVGLSASGLW